MLRGGDKVSSEVDSVGSSQNSRSPNKKQISAERREATDINGNNNKQRNVISGEEIEGGLKVFDLTNSKSKAKNNENVSGKDGEIRGDKLINPPSQPKRKSRASILLPFFDDLDSPVASPSPGMKGPRSQSRRMTLSPATARSLMMEVIGEERSLPCPFECLVPIPLTFSVYSEAVDIIPPRTGREAAEGPCSGPFNRSLPTQEQIYRLNSPAGKKSVKDLWYKQTAAANRVLDGVCGSSSSSIESIESTAALSMEQTLLGPKDDSSTAENINTVESERQEIRKEKVTSPRAEVAEMTVPVTITVEGDKIQKASTVQTKTTGSPSVDVTSGWSIPLCTTATVRRSSTYCEELDALLDSESDDNSSTTSSTRPYSPSLSTSLSSERSPSGSSSSPICLDHSSSPSSGSFADFCTNTASTDTAYVNQEYPKSPQKTGGNRLPLESSLDFLFSSSGSEDCSEVVMDDSQEGLCLLNSSIAVRYKSTKKGKKREFEDQEPLSPRDSSAPLRCSPNHAILLEHSDRIVVPKDICGSPIVMDVDENQPVGKAFLNIEAEQCEAQGMFKKSKVESVGEMPSFSRDSSPAESTHHFDQERDKDKDKDTMHTDIASQISHPLGSVNVSGSGIVTEELCTVDPHATASVSGEHHPVIGGSGRTRSARTGPSSTTLREAEMRALSRLGIRQEMAKWKYHWEVASYCAAQTAREAQGED